MNRRTFMQSALVTAASMTLAREITSAMRGDAEGGAAAAGSAAQPEWRKNGHWIIPTNKPTRFGLKVMEFNPIVAPDPKTWELTITGLAHEEVRVKLADIERLPRVAQSSRLKCVQCWSGRVKWEGFRAQELVKLARPKPEATFVRVECADKYYDFVQVDDLLHPRTMFAMGMNGEQMTPEHGYPLRLVLPHKYGYKSSKLITKITFCAEGGRGMVADGWPYYSETGDILPGVDHPFEFPDEARKIKGGEITEY